jgi:DNA polymerase I-like protein with 3'-5' exonuclease and polymerase domains
MDWQSPPELPDLRRAGIIALDLETRDDRLRADKGSGWPFRAGYICGVSVAWREGGDIRAHYFPLRHPDSTNFDPAQLFQWLHDLIASDVRIVTQNGVYDWGWLRTDASIKMPAADRLEEIGALATIVDENRFSYGLDALCVWRGVAGKDDTALKEGAAALGLPKRAKPAAHIWQMPARFVGCYAEGDAISTLLLFESFDPVLDREGTRAAYRLEVDLLPMVHEMRRGGIRIDVAAAEQARDDILQQRDAKFAELSDKLGVNVGMAEIGRTKWLAETFDKHGIKYPRTKKGNPSFTAGNSGWMPRHPHWLPPLIVKADKLNNAAVNFLQHYILDHVVNGRIHAEIHPHRSDEGGTRSLRFSYSDPPLQLMPAHDEEIAPLIRSVFLPEQGEVWAKPDISQQEFRFIVHYAAELKLSRADEAVARYRDNPDTDFHALVSEWTGIERQQAKNSNFAKAFGAGVRKFAAMIGKSEGEAHAIYNQYDRELPFVSKLATHCQNQANRFGFIELYDGARRHWNSWVARVDWTKGAGPCARDEAERRINDPAHPWYRKGPLRRVDTHKALNALIQGSAARHTKLWMRACWREGIVPLLQMHDSLDCSVSTPEQAERVAQLAREAVTLAVPIRVDLAFGHNWGDAKHSWEELHAPAATITGTIGPLASIVPEPADDAGDNGVGHDLDAPIAAISQTEAATTGAGALFTAAVTEITAGKSLQSNEALPWIDDTPAQKSGNGRAADGFDGIPDKKPGNKILCPFHDDHTPSLHIYPGEDDPHYHCFVCGAHGHLDELEIDWRPALESPTGDTGQTNDDARNLARAHELWAEAKPIAGTLAERYLAETRGIAVAAFAADIANALRFHPHCWLDGEHHPCLIALFRDVETDEPAGIHRTWLTPDAQKIDRRMFGRWPRPRAIKLWPAGNSLYVGEGIETVLAAVTRLRMQPAWALGSRVYIEKFPIISGVGELAILVDRDEHGEAAAELCRQTWEAAGRRVRRLRTKDAGLNDFNDLILKVSRADWDSGFEEIKEHCAGTDNAAPNNNSTGASDNGAAETESTWPILAAEAYCGIAGEVVTTLQPHTESDPVALLMHYLVYFGNCVGRVPYFQVESTRHFSNLFVVATGAAAKARKGTAAERIRRIFEMVDREWACARIHGGMSSGEGVIYAVRDSVYGVGKKIDEVIDPGIADKRLLLDEREFYQALTVMKREGNILSRVLRDAWDCREMLATLTKHSPTRATGALISVIGHITVEELRETLDHTSIANGYSNRFLFACVRRSKLLPHGGVDIDLRPLVAKTQEAVTAARCIDQVRWTDGAARMWEETYSKLSEDRPGMFGAITARAEAQTVRLAMIYALLDRSAHIGERHLQAALAVWQYCDASARFVFGDIVGNPVADTILRALRAAGADGLSRTDLVNLFGRNLSAGQVDAALVALLSAGKVRRGNVKKTGGRPREMWFAVARTN